jgi:hypothetical protein
MSGNRGFPLIGRLASPTCLLTFPLRMGLFEIGWRTRRAGGDEGVRDGRSKSGLCSDAGESCVIGAEIEVGIRWWIGEVPADGGPQRFGRV